MPVTESYMFCMKEVKWVAVRSTSALDIMLSSSSPNSSSSFLEEPFPPPPKIPPAKLTPSVHCGLWQMAMTPSCGQSQIAHVPH